MEIEEIMFSKAAAINTEDPFILSTKIFDLATRLGEIVEKKNVFQTDGPLKRSIIEFDIIRHYDDYSKFVISISLYGESNLRSALEVDMTGKVKTRIVEEGFFTSVFAEFYLENIYHNTIRRAKDDIKEAQKNLEKNIEIMTKKK